MPTITGTPPVPGIPFLFARGEDAAHDNQWLCTFNLSSALGFSNGSNTFQNIVALNPVDLRNRYQVIYIAPAISAADYGYLQQMVQTGGVIEQFVSLGGVAVINAAGSTGDQGNIAPGGVSFLSSPQHDDENIDSPDHAYVTGLGYGGSMLSLSDFSAWNLTDLGLLTNLPSGATVVLSNADGPSWVEYQYGSGRVIVTTLTYCAASDPSQLTLSQFNATANLLEYSRFYSGSALTPGATVTPTGSPTPTRTPRPSNTPTPTFTPFNRLTPTATVTPTPLPVGLPDIIGTIFQEVDAADADVNQDGVVTAADLPALINLLQ